MVTIDRKVDGAKNGAILEENLLEAAKDLRFVWRLISQEDNNANHTTWAAM